VRIAAWPRMRYSASLPDRVEVEVWPGHAFLADTAYPLMRAVAISSTITSQAGDGDTTCTVRSTKANLVRKNDMFSLGAIRFLYRKSSRPAFSSADAERRALAGHLDHMSEYRCSLGAKVTFRPDASTT